MTQPTLPNPPAPPAGQVESPLPRPAGPWVSIRRPISRPLYLALAVAGVIVLLAGYTLLAWDKKRDNPRDKTVPDWGQLAEGVGRAYLPDDRTGEIIIWQDAKATLARLAVGTAAGVGLGVGLGLLMGCYTPIEAAALPPVAFLARIPPPAIFTIILVLAGTNLWYFVLSIAIGITPILAQTVFAAVREDVPSELLDKARTMGASQAELIWDVIVPAVLPRVVDAVRLQLGPAFIFLVAAEYVNAGVGFGYQLRFQIKPLNVNVMIVYAVTLGLIGFALDLALRQLRRVASPWYGR